MTWAEFLRQRKAFGTQLFRCPAGERAPTVMLSSHIWWTEQIGLAILNAGYNVLFYAPLYLLYTDKKGWERFEALWKEILGIMRQTKVDVVVGGNTTAMLVHPGTRELLHEAASAEAGRQIPLVNWWWDEVRNRPPLERAGISPGEFVAMLGRGSVVNAIWDLDVKEELEAGLGLGNLVHAPLATLPEFWPHGYVPMEDRALAVCFLGNCHYSAEWIEGDKDPLARWARNVIWRKLAAPERPMQACLDETTRADGGPPKPGESCHLSGGKDPWIDFLRPWEFLNAAYMHYTRNLLIMAAAEHLRGKLALIGRGWEKLGLRANMEHAADKSGVIYGQTHVSLNLFGGCVHGGMPLRPFDIGASGGLMVTHDQRELHGERPLFEPGKECLTFRGKEEMLAIIDQVCRAPGEFNQVALAGRKRVLAEHTWGHRVKALLEGIGLRGAA